jgi:FkbM family methyltransferase
MIQDIILGALSYFKTIHTISGTRVKVPRGYRLPAIQRKHPLYDRFLPVLAKHIGDGYVVDVGANIGDTTLAMLPHCKNQFVCIEGSDKFYSYLEQNLASFANRVSTYRYLAGTGRYSGSLVYSHNSTAHLSIEHGQTKTHTSLDELIRGKVSLIKVDTDGYDFDVLMSGQQLIGQHLPVLFWENEVTEPFQLVGFDQLYAWLESVGYCHLFIFDNFGNIILENTSLKALRDINQYLLSIKDYGATRTFYYTDVLAVTGEKLELAHRAIENYRNGWIKLHQ